MKKNYNENKIYQYSDVIRIKYSKSELDNMSKTDLIHLLYENSKAFSYFNEDSRLHFSEIKEMNIYKIKNKIKKKYFSNKERSKLLKEFINVISFFRNSYSYINDYNTYSDNNTVDSVNSIYLAFKYCGKKIRKKKIKKMDRMKLINKLLTISWGMSFLTEGAIFELNDEYLNSLSNRELIRYLEHYNSNKMRAKVLDYIDIIINFLYENRY